MADRSNPERLLVDNLQLVDATVRWIARRRGLSADEADDFAGVVQLRLVEDDYRVLRAFRGVSSLRSYLITVIQRMALDFVIARSGKWRPSALARREGDTAVRLEALLARDGMTPDQAFETLLAEPGSHCTREQLVDLAARLPVRRRARPRTGEEEVIEALPDSSTPDRLLEQRAHAQRAGEIGEAFRRAFSGLRAEDRVLLKLRFESGRTVPQIAAALRTRPKRLYKRFDRLLRRLRKELTAAGVTPDSGAEADQVLPLVDLWPTDPSGGGNRAARPSPSLEDERA